MYCKGLAENTGRQKIAQLCRAVSLHLRHVSTIGNKKASIR